MVRGGGPDQNLMLLDGVPVYNASHLFGFLSVFNADAINRVELIKGGFPARYGGRLSSVIDINLKDGNMKEVHGEGSIDIIAAKVTVEGPIKKDKTSFLISARRTYLDALVSPLISIANKGDTKIGYYFYDLNTKFNHIINKRNRIYLSSYLGDDKVYAVDKSDNYRDEYGLKWGNIITAFRWNSVVGPRLFSNLTATYSRYRFNVYSSEQDDGDVYKTNYYSGIRDWALKLDYEFMPTPNHYIRYGVGAIAHKFSPGAFTYREADQDDIPQDTTIGSKKITAGEFSAYIEDDFKITDDLKVNVGAHASAFLVENKWYHSVQPRASARYLLGPNMSLKASFASMMQYIHLLTNAGLGLPTDLWVPSTADIKPQSANQVALGLARNFKSVYEISLEGYYKKMYNLIDYKQGTSFLDVQADWRDKVTKGGRGKSYGAELLAQKKVGKVTGWIGYTLSWTYRQFDDLNNAKWFPYKYDRRHDVSVALTHSWNERMDFSAVWVYGTGNAVTLPSATFQAANYNNNPIYSYYQGETYYYGDRNSFRMRAYHRLDLSFSFWKKTKWGRSKWTLACYNVYNRKNPFFMDVTHDFYDNRKFVQYSLFPIIPSIAYAFKF
ncbi:MAG: TonB-dependent receptor [Bacteroidota bacterium]